MGVKATEPQPLKEFEIGDKVYLTRWIEDYPSGTQGRVTAVENRLYTVTMYTNRGVKQGSVVVNRHAISY